VSVTSSSRFLGSLSQSITFDTLLALNISDANIPTVAHPRIILGQNVGAEQACVRVIVGGTSCEATEWNSASSIVCIVSAGRDVNVKVGLTSGVRVGTSEVLADYDLLEGLNLSTSSGYPGQWPSSPLPDRWSGPSEGGNSVTVTGNSFGLQDYTMLVSVGDTFCEASRWVADSSVVCKVPSVGWHGSLCDQVPCRVDHEVFLELQNLTTVAVSRYVFDCPCNITSCYNHNYTQAGEPAYCSNVNECDPLECDGTFCPSHNCSGPATCVDTWGSFSCTCDGVFGKVLSETGNSCGNCAAGAFKHSALPTGCNNVTVSAQVVSTNLSQVNVAALAVFGNIAVICDSEQSRVQWIDLHSSQVETLFSNSTNVNENSNLTVQEPVDIALQSSDSGVLVDKNRNVVIHFSISGTAGVAYNLAPHSMPCGVDISSDGTTAVVGFSSSGVGGSQNVALVDFATGNLSRIGASHTFGDPCSVSFTSDESAVLVADHGTSQLLLINLTSDQVEEIPNTNTDSILGTSDSEHAIISNIQDSGSGDGTLVVVHVDSGLHFDLLSGIAVVAGDVIDGSNTVLVFDELANQLVELSWVVTCAPGSYYSSGFLCEG